jgi:ABC-type antimicrobial peptide transport system ATPase subunit
MSARIAELMDTVHLPCSTAGCRPREFGGGQRQRIGIVRTSALEPDCLIADELVSALDVSVQAQMVNLRPMHHLSHPAAVMYLGRVVQLAETEDLFAQPHPLPVGQRIMVHHDSSLAGRLRAAFRPLPLRTPGGPCASTDRPCCTSSGELRLDYSERRAPV